MGLLDEILLMNSYPQRGWKGPVPFKAWAAVGKNWTGQFLSLFSIGAKAETLLVLCKASLDQWRSMHFSETLDHLQFAPQLPHICLFVSQSSHCCNVPIGMWPPAKRPHEHSIHLLGWEAARKPNWLVS